METLLIRLPKSQKTFLKAYKKKAKLRSEAAVVRYAIQGLMDLVSGKLS